MNAATATVHAVPRAAVERWLPELDAWLLDGAFYGVQHTWPQLYRRDGSGRFFVVTDGDRLLSHCAARVVTLRDEHGARAVALLGSVATAPEARGQGLAGQVLDAAIEALRPECDAVLLWAERPDLYARHGFAATADDRCLHLARGPRRALPPGVTARPATIDDHETLHVLHDRKPLGVVRDRHTMSTLLTTPGMHVLVLVRDERPVAYACCGKGADLQGHWHELGGSDEDLALLVPAAMHLAGQIEAALLLPPYRPALGHLIGAQVVDETAVPGPMAKVLHGALPRCWVDGLDSV